MGEGCSRPVGARGHPSPGPLPQGEGEYLVLALLNPEPITPPGTSRSPAPTSAPRAPVRSGSCGRSRCWLTMHRKPSGSPCVARNWCQVQDGIVTRSNGFTVTTVVAQQAVAVAAQDHHRMGMLVPLQRRIAAGVHFEIAQFAAHVGFLEQHLARDVLERRAAILLVRHGARRRPSGSPSWKSRFCAVCSLSMVSTDNRVPRRRG